MVCRKGIITVEAGNAAEAQDLVRKYAPEDAIDWNESWSITDCYESAEAEI